MYKHHFQQIARLFLIILFLSIIYIFIHYTNAILVPMLLAIVFSLALHPLVRLLEIRLKFPRIVATLCSVSIIFFITLGMIVLLVTEVVQGTAYLAEHVPTYVQIAVQHFNEFVQAKIIPFYEKLLSFFNRLDAGHQTLIQDYIKQATSSIAEFGSSISNELLRKIPSLLTMLPGSITVFIFILLATFIITNDLENLKQLASNAMPKQLQSTFRNVTTQFKITTFGFMKAQVILVVISATLIFIGLSILNIKHAFTISLFAVIVDLLPYIGTGIIFIPWILFLYITAEYTLTIQLTTLYMIVIIVRQVIEPKVLSSSIGIHPLVALITLFAGVQLWGFLGFILTPVFLIILNVIYQAGVVKDVWQFIRNG